MAYTLGPDMSTDALVRIYIEIKLIINNKMFGIHQVFLLITFTFH